MFYFKVTPPFKSSQMVKVWPAGSILKCSSLSVNIRNDSEWTHKKTIKVTTWMTSGSIARFAPATPPPTRVFPTVTPLVVNVVVLMTEELFLLFLSVSFIYRHDPDMTRHDMTFRTRHDGWSSDSTIPSRRRRVYHWRDSIIDRTINTGINFILGHDRRCCYSRYPCLCLCSYLYGRQTQKIQIDNLITTWPLFYSHLTPFDPNIVLLVYTV